MGWFKLKGVKPLDANGYHFVPGVPDHFSLLDRQGGMQQLPVIGLFTKKGPDAGGIATIRP